MKIDVTKPLFDYTGEPIKIGGKDSDQATLKATLELALTNVRDSAYQDGKKKYELYKLLLQIHEAEGPINIAAEDVATLKSIAGKMFNVPVTGAIYDALEGKLEGDKEAR